jgi:valyl-tRNA synthetase
VIVTVEEKLENCPHCGGTVEQDPDVLDTWFSSGLWPFSTLGWPEESKDLEKYYPSTVMETGSEILFFWVARMVFFGIEFMGEPPFQTVYLHGTVRDTEGAKMSKTKGNVLDPTEITEAYGADALRFALVTQGSPGLDMRLSMTLVESSRNFVNKLWNATRFALRAIHEFDIEMNGDGPARPIGNLALADRWILSRLDATNRNVDRLLAAFQFGEAGRQLRDFVWSELCDWYIEAAKVRLRSSEDEQRVVAQTMAHVLERSYRLLHPMMPFATEAMWQAIPHAGGSVMVARWPEPGPEDTEAVRQWTTLMELVTSIRNARAERDVEPARWIAADIYSDELAEALEASRRELSMLARIDDEQLRILRGSPEADKDAIVLVAGEAVAVLPLSGLVDLEDERNRIEGEIEAARQEESRAQAQLDNRQFVERAPAQVVQTQRDRLVAAKEKREILERRLAEIS